MCCIFVGVCFATEGDNRQYSVSGDSIKVLVSLVPWFPFRLDSSRGFNMAGWLRGGGKTTQTSWD